MNGVRVNGEQIVEVDLREGDEITIGDEDFVLEVTANADPNKKPTPRANKGTPDTPKRIPKPIIPLPPAAKRAPLPADLSQEYPIALPDDEDDSSAEDLRLPPPQIPESALKKLLVNFPDETEDSGTEDSGSESEGRQPVADRTEDDVRNAILELDSGELNIKDLDNLGPKK
jgi:pSer/pThr/pTyr-binding forkhead associated (FHA) protein